MTTLQEALLPCPFCGGPVQLELANVTRNLIHGDRHWYGVVCRNTTNHGGTCCMDQVPSASKEAAIARWNTRSALALQGEQPSQRQLDTAMRQWETWKAYALELQAKVVKHEGGSPMLLNTAAPAPQVQDKSDNYLSGYCTGRTDLLKEQSAQPVAPQDHIPDAGEMAPLTDGQIKTMWAQYCGYPGGILDFAKAIEAAHGITHAPK